MVVVGSASRTAVFVLVPVLVVALAIVAYRMRAPRMESWYVGSIVHGSIEQIAASTYRFAIRDIIAGTKIPDAHFLTVRYDGELPDTVCDDTEVYLEGKIESDRVQATSLKGVNTGKFWGCWRFRCSVAALRECERQRPMFR